MHNKMKLLLILVTVAAASLACATLSGGNATPTLIPTNPAPPTSTPLPPPPPTEEPVDNVLFQDDFSNPDSGWDRFNDDEGVTDYLSDGYLIGVYTDTYFYWANPYRTFQDVVIEVDAEMITDEEDNQYGIICRQTDVDNWYALVISGDGYAAIRKRFQGSDLEYLTDWQESQAINNGMASNKLRAECVGTRLALYVNGVLAVEASDSDLTTGDVGLLAGTFSASQTEIIFDNFVVTNP